MRRVAWAAAVLYISASVVACSGSEGSSRNASTGGSSGLLGGAASVASGGTSVAAGGGASEHCPLGAIPPAGECTAVTTAGGSEVCRYGETQCACQSEQITANWVCDACPATPANGDPCAVTGMVCGQCVCESVWIAGGQRAWSYNCGGSGTGGASSSGGTTGSGGATGGSTSATGGVGGATGGNSSTTGGVGGATGGSTSTTGGVGGATGGSSSTGGSPTCDESAIPTSPNSLTVGVSSAQQVIHKEIFGVLLEILGNNINNGIYVGTGSSIPNTGGIRNDIIDGFQEAGVGAIQWPGGCAANNYDWAANTNPSNTIGTDLFMDFCGWVDAEPYLVGRPQPQYADSNRQWVDYVNDNADHPEWNLKYFKIGNEVWGCGGDLGEDVATYETWYDAHYSALGDANLFLVGATGGIWTVNPNTSNWLTTMLSPGHIADTVDGIEIHDYIYFPDSVPCVGFSDEQYYDIVNRANEGQIAPRIRDIKTILDANDPSGRIQIMEDEWGDWLMELDASDTWFQQVTLMDAISAAEQLHVFMEHSDRVLMGGLAQSTNVIHSLFLTNSRSGGADLVKTPTFYVFKMFLPHHLGNATWAPNSLSSERINNFPVLSSGATVNDAGQVNISLVNVDLVNSRDITVTLDSATASYAMAGAEVLTGSAKDSYNDFGQAETVNVQPLAATEYDLCGRTLRVTLPSKSVVMLTLNRQ